MNPTSIRRARSCVPLFIALAVSATVSARAADPMSRTGSPIEPTGLRRSIHAPIDQVLFQEPGDGALWTRGAGFKARFDGGGATVVPFFGADAPQNYPLDLRVSSATVGAGALNVTTNARATREGNRVSIDRGAFVEEYDVALDSLEQRFVFQTLPRTGDLVLRMNAQSELIGSDRGASLRFENELGRVEYGEAFAIDAVGRKIALDSTLVDGVIQLTVPADFVATAALPLVIDPFITFFTVQMNPQYESAPDVAYDMSYDKWYVVFVHQYSATDNDVYARGVSGNGTLQPGLLTVDLTTDYWATPRIASSNVTNRLIVVAARIPAGTGTAEIAFLGIDAINDGTTPQYKLSPNDGVYRNEPDIGGDENTGSGATGNFCVVWQRAVNANNVDIEMQILNGAGTPQGGVVTLENGTEKCEFPRISNSAGLFGIAQAVAWTVVWQQLTSNSNHDIYAAQVSWTGGVNHPRFPVDTSLGDDTHPVASTILENRGDGLLGERPCLVVYERDYGDHDLIAVVLQGTSILHSANLCSGFGSSVWYADQILPSVDSDGYHFIVGHTEHTTLVDPNFNVFVSDYYMSSGGLTACSVHDNFAGSPQAEGGLVVASMHSGGGAGQHFFGAWEFSSINNSNDIQGGLWDTCAAGGPYQSFCSGDGSNTACPCGNNGQGTRGCAHSGNALGARIAGTGRASIFGTSFALQGSGMPASSPCLYFQGTSIATSGATSGAPFGDGLLCLAGTITRMAVVFNDPSGASSYGMPTVPVWAAGGVPTAGGQRYYQIWYRDAASFCTGSTFNLTNGLDVTWSW